MSERFTKEEYQELVSLTFDPSYPGLLQENEKLNGKNFDNKTVSFVTEGYLSFYNEDDPKRKRLEEFLTRAYNESLEIFEKEQLPEYLRPSHEMGILKVVKYDPKGFCNPHCDSNLITINLYRDPYDVKIFHDNNFDYNGRNFYHYGTLLEREDYRNQSLHSVEEMDCPQESVLYVVFPEKDSELSDGITVNDYIFSMIDVVNNKDGTNSQNIARNND